MYSYTIKGDLGDKGENVSRDFKAMSDETAFVHLASILGLRSQRKGREFRRRSRKNIFRKIPRLVLATFGEVKLLRDGKQILPRLKLRHVDPKKSGQYRNRRPVKHAWLIAA